MKTITREVIKQELWKADFRSLFPEITDQIRKYFAYPNCGKCFSDVYSFITNDAAKLSEYFGDEVQIQSPATVKVKKLNEGTKQVPGKIIANAIPAAARAKRRAPQPIQRYFRTWPQPEVEANLKDFPPPKYKIETMSQESGQVSFVFLEYGIPGEQEKGPTDEQVSHAFKKLREMAPNEALDLLDKLEDVLLPTPERSERQAEEASS